MLGSLHGSPVCVPYQMSGLSGLRHPFSLSLSLYTPALFSLLYNSKATSFFQWAFHISPLPVQVLDRDSEPEKKRNHKDLRSLGKWLALPRFQFLTPPPGPPFLEFQEAASTIN